MSWAEYKLLSDRQNPLYFNDKKVKKINIIDEPKFVYPIEVRLLENDTGVNNMKYIAFSSKEEKLLVHFNYRENGSTSSYPISDYINVKIFEYDLNTQSLTVVNQDKWLFRYRESSSSNAIVYNYLKSNDNKVTYINGSDYHNVAIIKINDFYVWVNLITVGGYVQPSYIGVSDGISGYLCTENGTPEHYLNLSPIPKDSGEYYNQYGEPIKIVNVDTENNDFYFLCYTSSASYQYTVYRYYFKAHINADKSITYTRLAKTDLGTGTSGQQYTSTDFNQVRPIAKNKFKYCDIMFENNIARELSISEKGVYDSFLSIVNIPLFYLKDEILYGCKLAGDSKPIELYRNDFYLDGKVEWTLVSTNFTFFNPDKSSTVGYDGIPQYGMIANALNQIFFDSNNKMYLTGAANIYNNSYPAAKSASFNLVIPKSNNQFKLNDLQFTFETN